MNCYHCGEPGHFTKQCPMFLRAESFAEHLARIDHYVAMWIGGLLSTEDKRRNISDENVLWHGPDCRRALLHP